MSYTKIQMYRAANRWSGTLSSLCFLLSRSLSKTKPSIALSRFQNAYLSAFPCPGPRLLAPLRPPCPACPSRPRAPGRGEGAPVRSPAPGGLPLRTARAAGSSPCARGLRFPSRAGRGAHAGGGATLGLEGMGGDRRGLLTTASLSLSPRPLLLSLKSIDTASGEDESNNY